MSSGPFPDQQDGAIPEDPRLNAYLFSLLDVGERVVQCVGRQADLQAQPTPEGQTPPPMIDVAEQYERVSRAMRRNILLVRHLAQARIANNPARQRTEARKQIIRKVENRIGCGTEAERESRDIEGLRAEFRERLDAPDLEEDITHRPIADIIADIVADLGLEDPFDLNVRQRRTPRDVQDLCARAAAPAPPGPYDPGPHGPDPGAPKPKVPLPPRDRDREFRKMVKMTRSNCRSTREPASPNAGSST